ESRRAHRKRRHVRRLLSRVSDARAQRRQPVDRRFVGLPDLRRRSTAHRALRRVLARRVRPFRLRRVTPAVDRVLIVLRTIRRIILITALVSGSLAAAPPARATDYFVRDVSDPDPGSSILCNSIASLTPWTLRWAVAQANSNPGPDNIVVQTT